MDNKKITLSNDFGKLQEEPTRLDDATGILYDFNCGCRFKLPKDGLWDVTISNSVTGDVFLHEKMPGGSGFIFPFHYYIPFTMEITDASAGKSFKHTMNLKGEKVAFKMMQRTLGDPLYMMAGILKFIDIHSCHAIIYASARINEILAPCYPHIEFKPLLEEDVTIPYATYYMGLFFNQDHHWQPYDFRTYSLIQQGQHILGLNDFERLPPPEVKGDENNPLGDKPEPYVAISYTGSKQCKFWNNPLGWYEVVKYLKGQGLRVICIDKDPAYGIAPLVNIMPPGVEDYTGNLPLSNRIAILKGAKFFIGTPSGLAALAWCCRIPVVMISGFSLPFAEFDCYRVINPLSECKGCWNDTRIDFNHHEMHWCPRIDPQIKAKQYEIEREELSEKPNKERLVELSVEMQELQNKKFICTKSITSNMVIAKIKEIMQ